MRLLSYNIHGCVGRDGIENQQRIVDVIRDIDADIVGLQEVYSDDEEDRDFLLNLRNLPYSSVLYGRTMRKKRSDYGNLLLFKGSAEQVERLDLSTERTEPRGAIVLDIKWADNQVRLASTHLGLDARQRRVQLAELQERLFSDSSVNTFVLMGDLNEWLPFRRYFSNAVSSFDTISRNRTFPTMPAVFALDRIAVAGDYRKVRFQTVRNERTLLASDHLPLVAEIDL